MSQLEFDLSLPELQPGFFQREPFIDGVVTSYRVAFSHGEEILVHLHEATDGSIRLVVDQCGDRKPKHVHLGRVGVAAAERRLLIETMAVTGRAA